MENKFMFLLFFIILNEINIIKSQNTRYVPKKCEGGYYYKGSGRTCSICEAGKYCPGDYSMYNCPIGTYSLEGASKCSYVIEEHIQIKKVHQLVIVVLLAIVHFLEEMNAINAPKEHIHQIWDLYA